MVCERVECSLSAVAPTARVELPSATSSSARSYVSTDTSASTTSFSRVRRVHNMRTHRLRRACEPPTHP